MYGKQRLISISSPLLNVLQLRPSALSADPTRHDGRSPAPVADRPMWNEGHLKNSLPFRELGEGSKAIECSSALSAVLELCDASGAWNLWLIIASNVALSQRMAWVRC